jgi:hypothetical protein
MEFVIENIVTFKYKIIGLLKAILKFNQTNMTSKFKKILLVKKTTKFERMK